NAPQPADRLGERSLPLPGQTLSQAGDLGLAPGEGRVSGMGDIPERLAHRRGPARWRWAGQGFWSAECLEGLLDRRESGPGGTLGPADQLGGLLRDRALAAELPRRSRDHGDQGG